MKLTTPLVALATLTTGVFSAPSSRLAERIQARSQKAHQSHPMAPLPEAPDASKSNYRQAANVAYSSNWAGVVREQPPPHGTYTKVSATFQVPEATAVGGNSGVQAGSAWVGIDGDTYSAAILQAGVDFYYDNGKVYNNAWYEWFPDSAHDFDLAVNTGDVIIATVESYSPSEGIAIIENRSTGETARQTISAPNADATLAGQNADWIVEDFQSGDQMVALADFSSVRFTGVSAKAGNKRYGVDGATVIELKQGGKVLTNVATQGKSAFRVDYIG